MPRNSSCQLCPLHNDVNSVCIFGYGQNQKDIFIIGEAPGYQEDMAATPFVGRSGDLLNECLAEVGLSRADVYTTNITKCRPHSFYCNSCHNTLTKYGCGESYCDLQPVNWNRDPTTAEAKICLDYLQEEIDNLKPKVIVLMGSTALFHFTGKKAITRARGKLLEPKKGINIGDAHLMATLHPSYALRPYGGVQAKSDITADLAMASQLAGVTKADLPIHNYNILLPGYTESMLSAYLERFNDIEYLALDLEWTAASGDGTMTWPWSQSAALLSCSLSGFTSILKNKIESLSFAWTPVCLPLMKELIPQHKIGGHNLISDSIYLRSVGIEFVPGYDTMAEAYHLDEEQPRSLEVLTSKKALVPPIYKHCLPLTARAITHSGFTTHTDLHIGDEILAYDQKTDTLKWSTLQGILKRPADNDMLTLKSKRFTATCSDNHKWCSEHRQTDNTYKATMLTPNTFTARDRLVLAAKYADTKLSSKITPKDAAILGWIVTDGHIRFNKNVASKHFNAKHNAVAEVTIVQSKTKGIAAIRTALREFTYSESAPSSKGVITFRIAINEARQLLKRTEFKTKNDLPRIVLALNHGARLAMLNAMLGAEGHTQQNCSSFFTQSLRHNRPIAEGFQLLCTLEGIFLGRTDLRDECRRWTLDKSRHVYTSALQISKATPQESWCPTTSLDTWVAEDNGYVFITGNTNALVKTIPADDDTEAWTKLLTRGAMDTYGTVLVHEAQKKEINALDDDYPELQQHYQESLYDWERKAISGSRRKQTLQLYHRVTLPRIKYAAKMSSRGAPVDRQAMKDNIAQQETKLVEVVDDIAHDLAADQTLAQATFLRLQGMLSTEDLAYVNKTGLQPLPRDEMQTFLNSPKRLLETLNGYMLAHGQKIRLSSTGKEVLSLYQDDFPTLAKIREYRHIRNKILGTYLRPWDQMLDQQGDAWLHALFSLWTSTGRAAAKSEVGGSLHQMPREAWMRRIIRAPKGCKLVSCDNSMIEMRMAAWLANEEHMIELFNQGVDLHTVTAAYVSNALPNYKMSMSEFWPRMNEFLPLVTKEQRDKAKPVNFGLLFGQQPKGFIEYARTNYGIHFTRDEAYEAHNGYFKLYPALLDYFAQAQLWYQRGWCITPFGRVRHNFTAPTEAINMPIQGAAQELLGLASIAAQDELEATKVKAVVFCEIHDSMIGYSMLDTIDTFGGIIQRHMERPPTELLGVKFSDIPVPLKADLSVSDYWGQQVCKECGNDKGKWIADEERCRCND